MSKIKITSTPKIEWLASYIGKSYDWVANYQTRKLNKSEGDVKLINDATRHYNLVWDCIGRMLQTRSKSELVELFKTLVKEL